MSEDREAEDRQAVRTMLDRKFGRAVPVTEAMVDSVMEGLRDREAGPQREDTAGRKARGPRPGRTPR